MTVLEKIKARESAWDVDKAFFNMIKHIKITVKSNKKF